MWHISEATRGTPGARVRRATPSACLRVAAADRVLVQVRGFPRLRRWGVGFDEQHALAEHRIGQELGPLLFEVEAENLAELRQIDVCLSCGGILDLPQLDVEMLLEHGDEWPRQVRRSILWEVALVHESSSPHTSTVLTPGAPVPRRSGPLRRLAMASNFCSRRCRTPLCSLMMPSCRHQRCTIAASWAVTLGYHPRVAPRPPAHSSRQNQAPVDDTPSAEPWPVAVPARHPPQATRPGHRAGPSPVASTQYAAEDWP